MLRISDVLNMEEMIATLMIRLEAIMLWDNFMKEYLCMESR